MPDEIAGADDERQQRLYRRGVMQRIEDSWREAEQARDTAVAALQAERRRVEAQGLELYRFADMLHREQCERERLEGQVTELQAALDTANQKIQNLEAELEYVEPVQANSHSDTEETVPRLSHLDALQQWRWLEPPRELRYRHIVTGREHMISSDGSRHVMLF